MICRLRLDLAAAPRSLERLLATAGRRGYEAVRLAGGRGGAGYQLELEVEGRGPATLLARQLARLVEVERVEILAPRERPAVTLDDVRAAERRIRPHLAPTPLVFSPALDAWLKLESLQVTGSFKVRGALNAVAAGVERGDRRPLVTASAGNHGQGVAWAARRFGLAATVVVPVAAPATKVARCEALGARVVRHGAVYDAASRRAAELAEEHGWRLLPAFDDPEVVAGQGTVALEMVELEPDVVVAPVAGGSLAGGMGLVLREHGIRLVGVQVEGVDAMARRLRGDFEVFAPQPTIADGLRVAEPGVLNLELCAASLDGIVLVSEEAVRSALVDLVMRERITAEGAGAVAAAALERVPGERRVAVVSGGNLDETLLLDLLAERRRCASSELPT